MMRLHLNAAVGGLFAVLAIAGVANAQVMNAPMGTYPTTEAPYNTQGTGTFVVAPGLRGPGASYGYVQQPVPRGMGMSPDVYYSQNFFTTTPMTPMTPYPYNNPYAYSSGYSNGVAAYPRVATTYPGGVTYPAAGVYRATPATGQPYANANATYYSQTRRVGPIRRLFGVR